MSRIGKQPISIPENVQITIANGSVSCSGPKGILTVDLTPGISVSVNDNYIIVSRSSDAKVHRAMHGTTRAMIANMVNGVTNGFTKVLELNGVGYSANMDGTFLKLSLGYSHDILFDPPDGIDIKAQKNVMSINGIDKQLVGQVAAKIRSFKPPEPYKGKGIRYKNEYIRMKKGKTVGG